MLLNLCLGLALLAADDEAAVKAELAKFQGVWEQQVLIANGKEADLTKDSGISKIVVQGDLWNAHWKEGNVTKLRIKLDPTRSPKTIDLGEGAGLLRAIYLIDGDHIVFRVGDVADERPTDFSSTQGGKTGGIIIYRRAKQAAPPKP